TANAMVRPPQRRGRTMLPLRSMLSIGALVALPQERTVVAASSASSPSGLRRQLLAVGRRGGELKPTRRETYIAVGVRYARRESNELLIECAPHERRCHHPIEDGA